MQNIQTLLNIIADLKQKFTISIIFNALFLLKIVAVYLKKYKIVKQKE